VHLTLIRRSAVAAASVATALVMTACGGNTDDSTTTGAGSASSAPGPSPSASASKTDAMFAAMMIPHHQMGLQITKLGTEKATNSGVKEIAERATESQQNEIPQLQSVASSGEMATMPPEDPMTKFNEQEMAELRSLSGTEFDLKWLDVLSSHHMAAIMMADIALAGNADAQAKQLQQKIHDEQLKGIGDMNTLRDQLRK
jgi:uncharacterized protein (DUF305 family)